MNTKRTLLYFALVLGGLLLGYFFFGGTTEPQSLEEHIAETHTDEEGNVVYTCSMHPQVHENEPGNCPICGMELIPANDSEGDVTENEYTLRMTNAAVKLAEIQTAPVRYGNAAHTFTLPGKVVENQNNVSSVTAHFPGRIRDLYVDYEGTYVTEGQKLASVYSPELIAAQQELLETIRYKKQNPKLYEAARLKLRLWEFPESTIDDIESRDTIMTELDFFSPVSGYIAEVAINREEHTKEGGLMYKVVNLSSVWVDFNAFESNIASIAEGDHIQFSVEAYPGKKFESTVIYIDPFLDNDSRSVTIRAKVENKDSALKPGMLAQASVQSFVSDKKELMVPRAAVMWTGKRSIVYVQQQGSATPVFEAREVVLGQRAGNYYIVESGLKEGELVVSNGTFKIDSAAQLADKLSMMNREPGTGANRTGHEGHAMPAATSPQAPADTADHSQHQPQPEDEAERTGHSHDDHLSTLVTEYLKMQNALVKDDFESAKKYLDAFANEVERNSEMTNHQEHAAMHESHHKAMLAAIYASKEAMDIKTLRNSYDEISAELTKAIQNQGYSEETPLYIQFCPMMNDGEGAIWISKQEEILNPYYGSAMIRCGETQEVISTN
ncbi:MAG: efflux RND transporter periplasmic adaptor subunit [Balneolaceae bacterium]|nr:efflux RND transporter periplasmic adaptor subunit [Balneolaceae bacterium]